MCRFILYVRYYKYHRYEGAFSFDFSGDGSEVLFFFHADTVLASTDWKF